MREGRRHDCVLLLILVKSFKFHHKKNSRLAQQWPTQADTTRLEGTRWRVPASPSAQSRTAPVSPPPALSRPVRTAGGRRLTSPQVRTLSVSFWSVFSCIPAFLRNLFVSERKPVSASCENMLQHCHHYCHLNITKSPSLSRQSFVAGVAECLI